MTSHDVQIIRQCLRAAVDGPFFPDWEFSTLIGAERLGADLFRIVSRNVDPEGEEWEFPEGAVVRCARREFPGGGNGLVAVEEVRVSDGRTPSS